MAYSAESLGNMTAEEAQSTIQATQNVPTSQQNIQSQKLQKLIDEKNSEKKGQPALVKYVTDNTTRVVKGLVTNSDEFVYRSGKSVPKETPYHIHYTNKLEEFFMTGNEHNKASVIITRVDTPTDFAIYQNLNPQKILSIKETTVKPVIKDVRNGFMRRYFTTKPNDTTPPFEITEKDMNKSPLYKYTTLIWHFVGTKSAVNDINNLALRRAEKKMSGITKLIPDLQYFVQDNKLNPKEAVENIVSKIKGNNTTQTQSQSTTQTQTQTQTQQQAASGYNAGSGGPPPGMGGY